MISRKAKKGKDGGSAPGAAGGNPPAGGIPPTAGGIPPGAAPWCETAALTMFYDVVCNQIYKVKNYKVALSEKEEEKKCCSLSLSL